VNYNNSLVGNGTYRQQQQQQEKKKRERKMLNPTSSNTPTADSLSLQTPSDFGFVYGKP